MKLQYKDFIDYILIDKPNGFSTHAPDSDKLGICEIAQQQLKNKFYIAQRLDKSTTGLLLLSKSAKYATQISELLKDKKIKKTYKFVTDRVSNQDSLVCNLPIDGKVASTEFLRLKRSPFFELWQAQPLTGRQHQVRIHAAHLGLPILGDSAYGGSDFPHLCLHAWKIFVDQEHISFPPPFIDRLGLLKDPQLVEWLSEIDRRQRLYNFLNCKDQCLRIVHTEKVRMDMFGEQICIYWYNPHEPTVEDNLRFEFIAGLLCKKYLVRFMQDRGRNPNGATIWQSNDWVNPWQAKEETLIFNFDCEMGLSPGLFLDQYHNRSFVKSIAEDKSVLNLFSYTCGFSLAAALGGAKQVISVDLNQKFLHQGRENFLANGIAIHKHEFVTADSMIYLKGALKRQRQFDIVICDPPSFARSKNGVFRLEKDFEKLISSCWHLVAKGGYLMFSCNYEKWHAAFIENKLKELTKIKSLMSLHPRWDFELPNQERLMKSFWLKKI